MKHIKHLTLLVALIAVLALSYTVIALAMTPDPEPVAAVSDNEPLAILTESETSESLEPVVVIDNEPAVSEEDARFVESEPTDPNPENEPEKIEPVSETEPASQTETGYKVRSVSEPEPEPDLVIVVDDEPDHETEPEPIVVDGLDPEDKGIVVITDMSYPILFTGQDIEGMAQIVSAKDYSEAQQEALLWIVVNRTEAYNSPRLGAAIESFPEKGENPTEEQMAAAEKIARRWAMELCDIAVDRPFSVEYTEFTYDEETRLLTVYTADGESITVG